MHVPCCAVGFSCTSHNKYAYIRGVLLYGKQRGIILIIRFPVASHLLGPVCLFSWSNFLKNGKVLRTDSPKVHLTVNVLLYPLALKMW